MKLLEIPDFSSMSRDQIEFRLSKEGREETARVRRQFLAAIRALRPPLDRQETARVCNTLREAPLQAHERSNCLGTNEPVLSQADLQEALIECGLRKRVPLQRPPYNILLATEQRQGFQYPIGDTNSCSGIFYKTGLSGSGPSPGAYSLHRHTLIPEQCSGWNTLQKGSSAEKSSAERVDKKHDKSTFDVSVKKKRVRFHINHCEKLCSYVPSWDKNHLYRNSGIGRDSVPNKYIWDFNDSRRNKANSGHLALQPKSYYGFDSIESLNESSEFKVSRPISNNKHNNPILHSKKNPRQSHLLRSNHHQELKDRNAADFTASSETQLTFAEIKQDVFASDLCSKITQTVRDRHHFIDPEWASEDVGWQRYNHTSNPKQFRYT